MFDLVDLSHIESLSLAVIERAIQDLTDRDSAVIREDAFAFLTQRLWEDECIWYDILGHRLVKRYVLEAVHKKVIRNPNGSISIRRP